MGRGLWFILELVIFGILGGIFLGLGIGAMILSSFMLSGLILENQIVFAYIPMYAGYLVGI